MTLRTPNDVRFWAKVRKTSSLEITADDIRQKFGLPPNAEVWVRVPGGGDWSNARLEIDDDVVVQASFTEEERR
jgi:hypothetical protein